MTHPFSDKAIEAAARAICEKHGRKWEAEFSFNSETRNWWIEEAEAALSAAFEHARKEGLAMDALGMQQGSDYIAKTNALWESAESVTIIKDASK